MKFNFILIFLITVSCAQNYSKVKLNKKFTSKGFAYIYTEIDYEKNLIKKELDSNLFQIAHNRLKLQILKLMTQLF